MPTYRFSLTGKSLILSLYRRIQVSENPYSSIICAVFMPIFSADALDFAVATQTKSELEVKMVKNVDVLPKVQSK